MTAEDRDGMSVHLNCSDMARSVRFYRDQCGFTMKESWPNDESPQWANMMLGKQSVMLGCSPEMEKMEQMCASDPATLTYFRRLTQELATNRRGVGLSIYLQVPDIDAHAATLRDRGVAFDGEPKTQFYGIRELGLDDPDGYRLIFYTPVTLATCQSCGMPLADAEPGQMYCGYCTDDSGRLRPYEQVFEGTVSGFFMAMQKMPRAQAEQAARAHLAQMPAWAHR